MPVRYNHRKPGLGSVKRGRERDREYMRKKQYEWYLRNKEKAHAASRRYYRENRESVLKQKRAWSSTNPGRFAVLRRRAKDAGIGNELTFAQYEKLIAPMKCHYCECDLSGMGGYMIDRMDSSAGYAVDNCVPCCRGCNEKKGTSSYESFIEGICSDRVMRDTDRMASEGMLKRISDQLSGVPF